MFPFFSYASSLSLLLLLISAVDSTARLTVDVDPNNTWGMFTRLLDAERGTTVQGLAELKRYFSRFGYQPNTTDFDDLFDDQLEMVLIQYQKNLGLSETGRIDYQTVTTIVSPRCGVGDFSGKKRLKAARRFAFFTGELAWLRSPPFTLTYAFSSVNTIDYVRRSDVQAAFRGAFAAWSAAIPVNFTETQDYAYADIKIGWFRGDHGDGESFDGTLGVLGHAFAPESGRLHLDAAERWSVDFNTEGSDVAVDLESVATHEIGHVLGLAHSSVQDSIMYPSLSPRTRKLGLRKDDVEGIQKLYGSNPNYKSSSTFQSDLSSGRVVDLEPALPFTLVLIFCLGFLL